MNELLYYVWRTFNGIIEYGAQRPISYHYLIHIHVTDEKSKLTIEKLVELYKRLYRLYEGSCKINGYIYDEDLYYFHYFPGLGYGILTKT